MQGLKKIAREKAAPSSHEKRQQEYSIGYEAYRHFAFFAGLFLQANAPTTTSAADLVKCCYATKVADTLCCAGCARRYLTEKAYCVPRLSVTQWQTAQAESASDCLQDLPRPLVPRVYTTLVNNLILDACVEVASNEPSGLQLLPNKHFLLWAWRDFALDFDVKMSAIPF